MIYVVSSKHKIIVSWVQIIHFVAGVTDIFSTSEDAEELKHAWLEWHKAAGAASKGNFTEYVNMYNEAAKLNGNFTVDKHTHI